MALWGNQDAANSAPKYNVEAGTTLTGNSAFGNVSVSDDRAVGVFGVDTTEAELSDMTAHAGWVIVRQGTGPVDSIAVANGGTAYLNTETGVISGGESNGAFTIKTDANGSITSVTLTGSGSGFKNTSNTTAAVTTANGTGAAFTVTLGGRAGRMTAETLVAMSSIAGDASDDAIFPDS